MWHIIRYHIIGCIRDLRARSHGDLEIYERPGHAGQLFVGDGRKEWRIR